jgi:hypothetical protein
MATPKEYRAKAAECGELAEATNVAEESRELRKREQSLTSLADNEEWMADNFGKTLRASHQGRSDKTLQAPYQVREGDAAGLAAAQERILRCLGAAVIMQWNTIPKTLQRELFDTAGSLGELLNTAALRGEIARFLHKHKDDAR